MNQLLVIEGVSVRLDNSGRYCLNDLHRAAGSEERHKPKYWYAIQQTQELVRELTEGGIPPLEQNQPVSVIRGGNQQGTYVCKELVYSYAMWISASFSLKVIRTFDHVVSQPSTAVNPSADKMQAGVILLEFMRKELNLSNSSVLGACQKLQQAIGLPNLAPQYAIDAPTDAVDGSSRPTMALSTVLKSRSIPIRATVAFGRLAELGIVERRSRPSTSPKAKGGIKYFWSVTSKGLLYGKNIISPGNPRETQPHFYESKVAELIKLMMTAKAA
ncbi:kilA-N domain protein [Yersinia enterocolitica]|uniref:KilA-N domain-containing protein n=1 Tax=Yersinia enterocolitica TaxID=630 RepID=UPI000501A22C|nr:KilA-N domain-containing protein [Yersinia enterocolitica]KGA75955.1 kilA-N domain protein [Yersinia enterocolitica]HDL7605309.1 KilA-N domain-containing protein [Yersinia enterocolitica]HDL7642281.1 KilA-N domain-containing protein [Yersinia enterocolitica]HDL7771214.1 KilA-N domain-containing protein [Yersinia enterocolitica]HDL7779031.1 KilA-N domain-containing protein [Yersinia enterocolitica]